MLLPLVTLILHWSTVAGTTASSTLHLKKPTAIDRERQTVVAVVSPHVLGNSDECQKEQQGWGRPDGPWVPCSFLPEEFIICEPPTLSTPTQNGTKEGCPRFGGVRAEDVAWTNVTCRVLSCIECKGPRYFARAVPCIKYTGHYFLSTLLYSIFLGVLAVDRFCLGYSAIAVGKLMTLGGLGVWWIIDIVLLVTGNLMPADDSNWEPYY